MKDILIYFSRIAVNYSKSLKKESLLVNKPWALLDDDKEVQKLIFKPNKELILSKNGNVKVGAWDYFPAAKSLLIDRVSDKMRWLIPLKLSLNNLSSRYNRGY